MNVRSAKVEFVRSEIKIVDVSNVIRHEDKANVQPKIAWRSGFYLICGLMLALLGASVVQDYIAYSSPTLDASKIVWLLDVSVEKSVFTWASVQAFFVAAILFFFRGRIAAGRGEAFRWHWLFLAGLFILLSLDDFLSIHEKISSLLEHRFQPSGLLHFAWAAPAGLLALLGLVAFVPFLRSLPPYTAILFVVASIVFLGGAVGLEMINGAIEERAGESFTYRMSTNAEEGLEMAGLLILIYALMSYLEQQWEARWWV